MQETQVSQSYTAPKDFKSLDIRLLVLDIDGTICGASNQVNEVVIQAIEQVQAKGVRVAIATGRMYRSALRFHALIGSTLPILAYQGAWIQEPTAGTLCRHFPLPASLAATLIDYFDRPQWRSLVSIHLYAGDRLYVGEVKSDTIAYQVRSSVEAIVVPDLRQVLRGDSKVEVHPTKVLAMASDPEVIAKLNLEMLSDRDSSDNLLFPPDKVHLTRSIPTYLEATHPQSHKGDAVRFLAEDILNLQPNNVMAIGDNFNDVEMLQYAGLGIAMGNAPSEVKAIADWVAPPIEADGVAAAIEKFLLSSK